MSWVRGKNRMMFCPKHPGQEWLVGSPRTCQECVPTLLDDDDGSESEAALAVKAAKAAGIKESLAIEVEIRGVITKAHELVDDEAVGDTARVAALKTAGSLLCYLHDAQRKREREVRYEKLKRQGERRFGKVPREIGTEHMEEVH